MRSIDNQLFITVVKRSNWICERCKVKPADTIHHIKPRSSGGKDTPDNLLHVCRGCHAKIHPWLKRLCGPVDTRRAVRGILATVFPPAGRRLNNVIVLERYSEADILGVYQQVAAQAQEENATGCP